MAGLPPGSTSGPGEVDFAGAPSAQKRAAFSFLAAGNSSLHGGALYFRGPTLSVADKK